MPGYEYYRRDLDAGAQKNLSERRLAASALGAARFRPRRRDPDYLILKHRKRLLMNFIDSIPGSGLKVLDVGGRIQPYRSLLGGRESLYIGLDPQLDGLVDVVAYGEDLPLADGSIDLVICTQVMSYAKDPKQLIGEAYRVLKPGGTLLMSAPAFFPMHHDERWRFLPEGMRLLLSDWSDVEILPEGHSLTGMIRTLNVCMCNVKSEFLESTFRRTLIPLLNSLGELIEGFGPKGTTLTPNYIMIAHRS